MSMHHKILSGLATCLLFVATLLAPPTGSAADGKPVVVYAAASLKNALDTISAGWQRTPGYKAQITYAASSTLAQKIEQGAPADVFISAGSDWMDYLAERKLVGEPKALVGNRLVLIAPRESKVEVLFKDPESLLTALGDGQLAVATVDSVPAGRYARESLESLGLWEKLSGRLMQADDVRAAMELVAAGKAPLGIVYVTDAEVEPRVRIVNVFAQTRHKPIVYQAAEVSRSKNPEAQAFLRYLSSPAARGVFAVNKFVKLGEAKADDED
jgi:molybdate transport system substrate-binding protein